MFIVGQFSQALTEIGDNLGELIEEIGKLKFYIESLEDENTRLKRQMCALSDREAERVQHNSDLIREQARENLDKLYQEGFHVCHIYFGEQLEESCLFCNAFLRYERS